MRTSSANAAIPGRALRRARATGCAAPCTNGSSDTANHRRQPTGLALTPAGAAAKHSGDSKPETGLPLRPSLTSTGPGLRLTQTRSATADGQRLPGPAAETPGTYETRCPASLRSTTTLATSVSARRSPPARATRTDWSSARGIGARARSCASSATPTGRRRWITRYLNGRFLRLPEQVEVLVREQQGHGQPRQLQQIHGERHHLQQHAIAAGAVPSERCDRPVVGARRRSSGPSPRGRDLGLHRPRRRRVWR